MNILDFFKKTTINVTQKDIDNSRNGVERGCPIEIAMRRALREKYPNHVNFEDLDGEVSAYGGKHIAAFYGWKRHRKYRYKLRGEYNQIRKYWFSHPTMKQIWEFVRQFDNNLSPQPFSFKIRI